MAPPFAVAAIVGSALGPPPVPFAFFVLGSEGRSESTLFTDQDNALVYLDPPAPEVNPAGVISGNSANG